MDMCPLKTWKLYISKLNTDVPQLWQKAKQGFLHYTDPVWYEPRVVGKDMLERYMKLSLAKSVKLDGDYTNHSIRSTVISTLDTEGFEARHICALSSHKNEATICEYLTKCPDSKRKEMYDALSNAMSAKQTPQKAKAPPSATISKPPTLDINDVKNNLPNFDLQEMDQFDMIDDNILANLLYDIPKDSGIENQGKVSNAVVAQNKVHKIPKFKYNH